MDEQQLAACSTEELLSHVKTELLSSSSSSDSNNSDNDECNSEVDEPPSEPGQTAHTTDNYHYTISQINSGQIDDVLENDVQLDDSLKHAKEKGVTGKVTYRCKFCGYRVKRLDTLKNHEAAHKEGRFFNCGFCDFSHPSKTALREHETRHTGEKPFHCDKCPFKSKWVRDLSKHKRVHSAYKKFSCHICSFRSKWKGNLDKHLITHSHKRPFQCPLCEKRFKSKGILQSHLRVHSSQKDFSCDQCDFKAKTRFEIKNHKLSHSDIRNFPCTFPGCEQRCKTNSDRLKHMAVHLTTKDWVCNLCGKGFKDKYRLTKHLQGHREKGKEHSCHICGKIMYSKAGYRHHVYNHKSTKKFMCSVCGHLFNNFSNMKVHMQVHDSTRSFQCPICYCRSRVVEHLLTHIGQYHSSSYAYICELCKKPFGKYLNLRFHIQRCHKTLMNADNTELIYDPDCCSHLISSFEKDAAEYSNKETVCDTQLFHQEHLSEMRQSKEQDLNTEVEYTVVSEEVSGETAAEFHGDLCMPEDQEFETDRVAGEKALNVEIPAVNLERNIQFEKGLKSSCSIVRQRAVAGEDNPKFRKKECRDNKYKDIMKKYGMLNCKVEVKLKRLPKDVCKEGSACHPSSRTRSSLDSCQSLQSSSRADSMCPAEHTNQSSLSVPQIAKQTEPVPSVIRLGTFAGVGVCLVSKNSGLELNYEKTGKKPRKWFMEPTVMPKTVATKMLKYMKKRQITSVYDRPVLTARERKSKSRKPVCEEETAPLKEKANLARVLDMSKEPVNEWVDDTCIAAESSVPHKCAAKQSPEKTEAIIKEEVLDGERTSYDDGMERKLIPVISLSPQPSDDTCIDNTVVINDSVKTQEIKGQGKTQRKKKVLSAKRKGCEKAKWSHLERQATSQQKFQSTNSCLLVEIKKEMAEVDVELGESAFDAQGSSEKDFERRRKKKNLASTEIFNYEVCKLTASSELGKQISLVRSIKGKHLSNVSETLEVLECTDPAEGKEKPVFQGWDATHASSPHGIAHVEEHSIYMDGAHTTSSDGLQSTLEIFGIHDTYSKVSAHPTSSSGISGTYNGVVDHVSSNEIQDAFIDEVRSTATDKVQNIYHDVDHCRASDGTSVAFSDGEHASSSDEICFMSSDGGQRDKVEITFLGGAQGTLSNLHSSTDTGVEVAAIEEPQEGPSDGFCPKSKDGIIWTFSDSVHGSSSNGRYYVSIDEVCSTSSNEVHFASTDETHGVHSDEVYGSPSSGDHHTSNDKSYSAYSSEVHDASSSETHCLSNDVHCSSSSGSYHTSTDGVYSTSRNEIQFASTDEMYGVHNEDVNASSSSGVHHTSNDMIYSTHSNEVHDASSNEAHYMSNDEVHSLSVSSGSCHISINRVLSTYNNEIQFASGDEIHDKSNDEVHESSVSGYAHTCAECVHSTSSNEVQFASGNEVHGVFNDEVRDSSTMGSYHMCTDEVCSTSSNEVQFASGDETRSVSNDHSSSIRELYNTSTDDVYSVSSNKIQFASSHEAQCMSSEEVHGSSVSESYPTFGDRDYTTSSSEVQFASSDETHNIFNDEIYRPASSTISEASNYGMSSERLHTTGCDVSDKSSCNSESPVEDCDEISLTYCDESFLSAECSIRSSSTIHCTFSDESNLQSSDGLHFSSTNVAHGIPSNEVHVTRTVVGSGLSNSEEYFTCATEVLSAFNDENHLTSSLGVCSESSDQAHFVSIDKIPETSSDGFHFTCTDEASDVSDEGVKLKSGSGDNGTSTDGVHTTSHFGIPSILCDEDLLTSTASIFDKSSDEDYLKFIERVPDPPSDCFLVPSSDGVPEVSNDGENFRSSCRFSGLSSHVGGPGTFRDEVQFASLDGGQDKSNGEVHFLSIDRMDDSVRDGVHFVSSDRISSASNELQSTTSNGVHPTTSDLVCDASGDEIHSVQFGDEFFFPFIDSLQDDSNENTQVGMIHDIFPVSEHLQMDSANNPESFFEPQIREAIVSCDQQSSDKAREVRKSDSFTHVNTTCIDSAGQTNGDNAYLPADQRASYVDCETVTVSSSDVPHRLPEEYVEQFHSTQYMTSQMFPCESMHSAAVRENETVHSESADAILPEITVTSKTNTCPSENVDHNLVLGASDKKKCGNEGKITKSSRYPVFDPALKSCESVTVEEISDTPFRIVWMTKNPMPGETEQEGTQESLSQLDAGKETPPIDGVRLTKTHSEEAETSLTGQNEKPAGSPLSTADSEVKQPLQNSGEGCVVISSCQRKCPRRKPARRLSVAKIFENFLSQRRHQSSELRNSGQVTPSVHLSKLTDQFKHVIKDCSIKLTDISAEITNDVQPSMKRGLKNSRSAASNEWSNTEKDLTFNEDVKDCIAWKSPSAKSTKLQIVDKDDLIEEVRTARSQKPHSCAATVLCLKTNSACEANNSIAVALPQSALTTTAARKDTSVHQCAKPVSLFTTTAGPFVQSGEGTPDGETKAAHMEAQTSPSATCDRIFPSMALPSQGITSPPSTSAISTNSTSDAQMAVSKTSSSADTLLLTTTTTCSGSILSGAPSPSTRMATTTMVRSMSLTSTPPQDTLKITPFAPPSVSTNSCTKTLTAPASSSEEMAITPSSLSSPNSECSSVGTIPSLSSSTLRKSEIDLVPTTPVNQPVMVIRRGRPHKFQPVSERAEQKSHSDMLGPSRPVTVLSLEEFETEYSKKQKVTAKLMVTQNLSKPSSSETCVEESDDEPVVLETKKCKETVVRMRQQKPQITVVKKKKKYSNNVAASSAKGTGPPFRTKKRHIQCSSSSLSVSALKAWQTELGDGKKWERNVLFLSKYCRAKPGLEKSATPYSVSSSANSPENSVGNLSAETVNSFAQIAAVGKSSSSGTEERVVVVNEAIESDTATLNVGNKQECRYTDHMPVASSLSQKLKKSHETLRLYESSHSKKRMVKRRKCEQMSPTVVVDSIPDENTGTKSDVIMKELGRKRKSSSSCTGKESLKSSPQRMIDLSYEFSPMDTSHSSPMDTVTLPMKVAEECISEDGHIMKKSGVSSVENDYLGPVSHETSKSLKFDHVTTKMAKSNEQAIDFTVLSKCLPAGYTVTKSGHIIKRLCSKVRASQPLSGHNSRESYREKTRRLCGHSLPYSKEIFRQRISTGSQDLIKGTLRCKKRLRVKDRRFGQNAEVSTPSSSDDTACHY